MAVNNSLANRQTKTGLAAYLTQDAVKKQINSKESLFFVGRTGRYCGRI